MRVKVDARPQNKSVVSEDKAVNVASSLVDEFKDDPRINKEASLSFARQAAELARKAGETRGPIQAKPEPIIAPTKVDASATTALSPALDDIQARITNKTLGAEWVRQDFPSGGIAYDGQDIFVKPLSIINLSRLSAAAKASNMTMYIDSLASCISIDIRSLTASDFTFFLYWLRINTFPTAPMVLRWISKYGNECEYRVNQTNLDIIDLKMTRKEYEGWLAQGICLPTVRDMELVTMDGIPAEDRWRVELAQYVYTNDLNPKTYLQSKLNLLDSMGVESYLRIQEFSKLIEHGVIESAKVRDNKFEPTKAIEYLRNHAKELEAVTKTIVEGNLQTDQEINLLAIAQRIQAYYDDADEIEKKVKAGSTVVPDEEVIALSINAMTFFPKV